MFYIKSEEGSSMLFKLQKDLSVGDNKFIVDFDLTWAKGGVISKCSKEKLVLLGSLLKDYLESRIESFKFIDDGTVDFEISKDSMGRSNILATLMPNMINDDQIEFSFSGFINVLTT